MSEAPVDAGVLWLRSWAVQVRMGAGAQTEGLWYRRERAGPGPPRKDAPPPSLRSPGAPRASSRLGDEARLRSLWAGQKGAPGLDVSWVSANWRPFWAHPLVERVPVFANGGGSVHPRTALLSPCWSPTHGETVSMRSRSASASGVLGAAPRRASGAGPGCGGRGRRARAVGFRSDPPPPRPGAPAAPRGPGKGISEPGRLQPGEAPAAAREFARFGKYSRDWTGMGRGSDS